MKMAEYATNKIRNIRLAVMYTRRQGQDSGGVSYPIEKEISNREKSQPGKVTMAYFLTLFIITPTSHATQYLIR
jgi:hypothetical protein